MQIHSDSDPAPLLVTGAQRSGTAYIAAVLTTAGHWCSHERFFNEHRRWPMRPNTIDSAWAAAAFLPSVVGEQGALVVHQTRHPLKVVSTLMAQAKFLGKRKALSARWTMKQRPEIARKGDSGLLRTMRYWVVWNRLVEPHSMVQWRVEDVSEDQISPALLAAGRDVDPARVQLAVELISADVNARPEPAPQLSWDDLPDGKVKNAMLSMAERYGYAT